ncbi:hypothetical protein AB1E22_00445 [Buttiauxella gaviniae]|uniref:Uncharacterized protein n=1 Tax=Buttiauxella gaviniae TaxID=82990 RepID=A0ABV3NNT2_9ENTR
MTILKIAAKWREAHPEHVASGVVLIWNNKAYGWKNELRDPSSEQPGSYAIDINNNVFIAEGGNDYDGAKCWVATAINAGNMADEKYYKIFSTVKNAWWQQDKYGYTDEYNAGYWSEAQISIMTLDDEQNIVEYKPSRLQLRLRGRD